MYTHLLKCSEQKDKRSYAWPWGVRQVSLSLSLSLTTGSQQLMILN